MTQRALAERLGIFPSRLVLLLDDLARRGLVERQASPKDRRSHVLRLTAAGTAQLEAIARVGRQHQEELCAGLTEAERTLLQQLLEKIAAHQKLRPVFTGLPKTGSTERSRRAGSLTPEGTMNILTVNLLFSTLIFWIAARIYVLPRLSEWEARSVLIPILLLHAFRHFGLMFLARGATFPGMPRRFAFPAALGDLLAAVLALIALFAIARNARSGRALVWIFSIEGSVDLLFAIVLATIYDAQPYMGPAYWIPALWVPALLVTHYLTFILLRRDWKRST
jgi:DNA-binding HxlR family transcriptional regulator